MTEYVILVVGDGQRWAALTPEDRKHGYAEYGRFGEELTKRGHKITGGAELHLASDAKRIEPGATVVTDGPFAEAAEQVGGFYLVETDDLDDVLDCCTILTDIGIEGVEVRKTVTAEDRAS